MSTMDDAAMAAAWELAKGDQTWAVRLLTRLMMAETPDLFAHNTDQARTAIVAAWPILSAPLRELHKRDEFEDPEGTHFCVECYRYTGTVGFSDPWPCPTMQAVHETDRALGIGEGEA